MALDGDIGPGDAPEARHPTLSQRVAMLDEWVAATADARADMCRDEDFYYGKQRTREEIEKLKQRKQPVVVDNLIRRKVNTVRGEEIEKRTDPVAKPRTPDSEDDARAITDALRFVEEDQGVDEIGGDIMLDLQNAGQGGIIVEADSEDGYRCTVLHVPWRQIAADPRSKRRDCSDARWLANVQWFDLDDAIDAYPESAEELKRGCDQPLASSDSEGGDRPGYWHDSRRKRVKICEMYYRVGRDWYRSDFTAGAELRAPAPSAYLDPRTGRPYCPLIVGRVYLDSDNNPQGTVRDMVSPQEMVNKCKSKLMHIINTKGVVYEEDAIPDITKFQTELAKPDGAAMVAPDALSSNKILMNVGADMGPGQMQLLQEAKQAIDTIGPASSNLPDIPNGASGRAFAFRQKAAARESGPLFEIFGKMRLQIYWHIYGCIRQFWTDEMWLRVTDDNETAGFRFVGLNRQITRGQRVQELLQEGVPLPHALKTVAGKEAQGVMQRVQQMHQAMAQQAIAFGQPPPGGPDHMLQMVMQDPLMGEQIIHNNVAEAMVDITIHEAPESAILEDEEFSKLSELAGTIIQTSPQMAQPILRMLIQLSTFRDKRKLLAEMDKPPTEQQQQMQQQQQQLAQQMQQIQLATAQANIAVANSQAQLNASRASAEQGKLQQSGAKLPSEIEENKASAALSMSKAQPEVIVAVPQPRMPPWA